ncbi:Uncharacterised protein [Mycobacteroides abscessus subsp. abscessus]|nr:Uncharacterised protein [Mycobacteroides abscessus subsp. abscessus]
MVTLTSPSRGSTALMRPAFTPRIRTSSPGYNPTADAKCPMIL